MDGPLGDSYDVVVCRACGAGFADGIPTQAEFDAYYAERSKYTYDQTGGAESPYDFGRFEQIADQIVPSLPSREARILDVGCATGGLLAVLKRRGYANVVGADPSPACAAAARRLHGVEVRVATLAQLAEWKERFDFILLVGVLEHLREVRPAVETVARRLGPGGLLYCAQPDVAAFADCVNAPYQQFSTEHMNFFSESSLDRLMAASGFAPRQVWHWLVEWREGVTDSVVSGIYAIPPPAEVPGSRSQVSGVSRFHTAAPQIGGSGSPIASVMPVSRSAAPPAPQPFPPVAEGAPLSPPASPKPAAGEGGHLPHSCTPALPSSLPFDRETEPALQRYLERCRVGEEKILASIEELVRSREPILIWGAGTLTRRLLATTSLGRANIVAFVDSNKALQGQNLAGREIVPPATLAPRKEAIVIASRAFEREIVETIRNELKLSNRIITL